jgi:hypothetical protein
LGANCSMLTSYEWQTTEVAVECGCPLKSVEVKVVLVALLLLIRLKVARVTCHAAGHFWLEATWRLHMLEVCSNNLVFHWTRIIIVPTQIEPSLSGFWDAHFVEIASADGLCLDWCELLPPENQNHLQLQRLGLLSNARFFVDEFQASNRFILYFSFGYHPAVIYDVHQILLLHHAASYSSCVKACCLGWLGDRFSHLATSNTKSQAQVGGDSITTSIMEDVLRWILGGLTRR